MGRNDYRLWKRRGAANLVPDRVRLQGACALDIVLTTRGRRPWLDEPELARLVFERALDEAGTAAVCVLPDRVLWLLDAWPDLEERMGSFRIQAGEYAQIYGAPEGRVWQRSFQYRPLADFEVAVERAREIVRAPEEAGVRARHPTWPAGLSGLLDENGRPLWRASRVAGAPSLWTVEGRFLTDCDVW
jgi:hypothetical protein